jgi:hypothetical protein
VESLAGCAGAPAATSHQTDLDRLAGGRSFEQYGRARKKRTGCAGDEEIAA